MDPIQDNADAEQLVGRLAEHVGREPARARLSRDPVNRAMVHHWCAALGDRNPAYTDDTAAAATAHGGRIAPPAMLQTWCLEAEGEPEPTAADRALELLGEHGFSGVVATDYEQTYERPLREGDRLSVATVVETVSPRKSTALGEGHFVTLLNTFRDDSGAIVGTALMRVLKYRPRRRPDTAAANGYLAAPPSPKPQRPRPAINRDNAFFWEGIAAGRLLIQRCAACKQLRHPPRPMCGHCGALEWGTVESSGRGVVHSYVVHHHPPLPGFGMPVTVVLVDLDEGVRLVAGFEGDVGIGDRVEVSCRRVDDDLVVPVFRPAEGSAE